MSPKSNDKFPSKDARGRREPRRRGDGKADVGLGATRPQATGASHCETREEEKEWNLPEGLRWGRGSDASSIPDFRHPEL